MLSLSWGWREKQLQEGSLRPKDKGTSPVVAVLEGEVPGHAVRVDVCIKKRVWGHLGAQSFMRVTLGFQLRS